MRHYRQPASTYLQSVQNAAARLVIGLQAFGVVTTSLLSSDNFIGCR